MAGAWPFSAKILPESGAENGAMLRRSWMPEYPSFRLFAAKRKKSHPIAPEGEKCRIIAKNEPQNAKNGLKTAVFRVWRGFEAKNRGFGRSAPVAARCRLEISNCRTKCQLTLFLKYNAVVVGVQQRRRKA